MSPALPGSRYSTGGNLAFNFQRKCIVTAIGVSAFHFLLLQSSSGFLKLSLGVMGDLEQPGVMHSTGMVVGFVGVEGDTSKRTTERKFGAAQG